MDIQVHERLCPGHMGVYDRGSKPRKRGPAGAKGR
jgi:hypothetical protein